MAPTVVLISGANRGLGKGLVERYLVKPEHTVAALVRDPEHSTSQSLQELPLGSGSKLILSKYDATVAESPVASIKQLQDKGIEHIDVVIAGAAVGFNFPYVRDVKLPDLQAHLDANVFGVLSLFHATRSLLLKAKNPKWVTMGSSAGCLVNQNPVPSGTYGPSKAAIHWLTKRMDGEEDEITAIVMEPGWVQTEMGNAGATAYGMEKAPLEVPESTTGVIKVIEEAAKESHGGKMWAYNGKEHQW